MVIQEYLKNIRNIRGNKVAYISVEYPLAHRSVWNNLNYIFESGRRIYCLLEGGSFGASRHQSREGTVTLPATGKKKNTSEHMQKFHKTVR